MTKPKKVSVLVIGKRGGRSFKKFSTWDMALEFIYEFNMAHEGTKQYASAWLD